LYNQKVQKIIQYEKLEDKGKIDIFRFDESGFSPTSNCPYLWSEVNNTAVVKTLSIKRINVLGFLSRNGTLKSYIADGRVDSDKVIEVFDDFTTTLSKPTVVILDNASYHKSKKFKANLLAYVKKIFNNYGTGEDEYFINFNRLEDELLEIKLLPFKEE